MQQNKGFFDDSANNKAIKIMGLNPAQQEAVDAPHEPLLIVAGAGTGKTKTLTSRLRRILDEGVPPERVCALTFTNKAAREMRERVGIQQGAVGGPFVGTFHSLGARILRSEARLLGRTRNFAIFDDHDSREIVKKLLGGSKKKTTVGEDKKENSPAFFIRKISDLKNGVVERESLLNSTNPKDRTVPNLFDRYEAALEDNNAFDFDDLIQKVVFLLKGNPALRTKYEARAEYLLIDEYQDLNNMQYELVRILSGHSRKVSVVGDDQQMIYTFRGSNFDIFLNFEKDWEPARVVLLEQNYRSTNTILRAASGVIAHNHEQKAKTLWTEGEEGTLVKIFEATDEEDEARWIAEEILKSKERGAGDNAEKKTAILYRMNAQSRALEQALLEYEIPYHIFGGITFYERREVKDIVAALRYAVNPKDSVSRDRLFKTFRRKVFEDLIRVLHVSGDEAPGLLIGRILAVTNYVGFLEHTFTNAEERIENIRALANFAKQFSEISEFLERIALLQAADPIGEQRGTPVELMTIHLSKGLEFDRVFLAGACEGILPHARSMDSVRALEEERRLMYVAMTRARRELAVSFFDIPSRFVSEIPQECTEFANAKSKSEEPTFIDSHERFITMDE